MESQLADVVVTDIGANPSAEEADEGLEDSSKTVNNVVQSFRLNYLGDEASGSRLYGTAKDYMSQFKSQYSAMIVFSMLILATAYLKKVVAALKENGKSEEEIKKFQSGVQKYFTEVIKPNFKDYDFYVGESMDTDGM